MAARIRKDDLVYVISGDDKGKTGKVVRVFPDQDKVLIEGVNVQTKHLKPSQEAQKGGRIRKPMPIAACKVMPVDPKTGRGARVKFTTENGTKRRVAAKSGSDLGQV